MIDSNMKVVVIGALPADRVAPSRSYLVVNGERVSYAHLVYYRGGSPRHNAEGISKLS